MADPLLLHIGTAWGVQVSIPIGSYVWGVDGYYPFFGEPEQAAAYRIVTSTVFTKVYAITKFGQEVNGGYRYSVSGLGTRSDTGATDQGWGPVYVYRATAAVACASGQAIGIGDSCVSSGLTSDNYNPSTSPTGQSVASAVASLSSSDLGKRASDDALASAANALWDYAASQDASIQARTLGTSITPADVASSRASTGVSPTVSDLVSDLTTDASGNVTLPAVTSGSTSGTTTVVDSVDQCSLHPEAAGCAELGTVTPVALPSSSAGGSLGKTGGFMSYESAVCPTDPTYTILGSTYSFPIMTKLCWWAQMLRPVVLIAATLIAIGVFFGFVNKR